MNEAKLYENESEKKDIEDERNSIDNNKYINEKILNDEDALPYSRNLFENKNDTLLNQVEVDSNIINEHNNNNSQIKNLILNEEKGYNKNRNENDEHYGNIGKNIVFCNKYVFGIKSTFYLFIFTFIGMVLTFLGWVISNNKFYSLYIYIGGGILFLLTQIFFILCFLTEPGIIPRNDPNFIEKDNKANGNVNNEKLCNILINSDNKNERHITNNSSNIKEEISVKENNSNNNNKKISIPKIFTERKCPTCGIIRPPSASHCRYCNNCIFNLDHHCFYISNCVGQRNHKYFYLFLFFGTITAIYLTICGTIISFYIFVIKPKKIWRILFTNNLGLMIISIILILISLIYAILGAINIFILLGPSGIGAFIFIILFYINKPDDYESYRNPFCIIATIASSFLGIFVIMTFIKQTRAISSGLTIKQNNSITNEYFNNSLNRKNIEFDKDYFSKKSLKEKFNNIIIFLRKKIGKSLIVPERDLFERK